MAAKPEHPVLNPNSPLAEGLWAAWLYHEAAETIRDFGPNGLDATLQMPAGWVDDAAFGVAYHYQETQARFETSLAAALPANRLTVSILITTHSLNGDFAAFPTSVSETRQIEAVVGYNGPQVRLILNVNGQREDFTFNEDEFDGAIATGEPVLWTFRWNGDAGTVTLFRNGAQGPTRDSPPGQLNPDPLTYGLGGMTPSFSTHDQVVHAVWMWDRMLSSNEIQALNADPFGWWSEPPEFISVCGARRVQPRVAASAVAQPRLQAAARISPRSVGYAKVERCRR